MIPLNRPFLPPKKEFQLYIDDIWNRNWLTNNGPLLQELEQKLKHRLDANNLVVVSNGTIALQLAIKSLAGEGEIITTPFSFVATSSSIVWEGCAPVYCDIDPSTLNIDASKIEDLITERTTCILATHVYGNPCDIEAIEDIAEKYGLPVIYDAAHAFDVSIFGKSIFSYGDIATCSLHATKYYHSVEGGLVISKSEKTHQHIASMRSFGFKNNYEFAGLGINGKNSEFHAAMGLANLKYLSEIKAKRQKLSSYYDDLIKDLPVSKPLWHKYASKNYAYYPIIFEDEKTLLRVMTTLSDSQIQSRRYFYPSLSSALPYIDTPHETPVSESISKRVLCLPLYFDLTFEEVARVAACMEKSLSAYYV